LNKARRTEQRETSLCSLLITMTGNVRNLRWKVLFHFTSTWRVISLIIPARRFWGLFCMLQRLSHRRIIQHTVLLFTLNNLAISVCFTFFSHTLIISLFWSTINVLRLATGFFQTMFVTKIVICNVIMTVILKTRMHFSTLLRSSNNCLLIPNTVHDDYRKTHRVEFTAITVLKRKANAVFASTEDRSERHLRMKL